MQAFCYALRSNGEHIALPTSLSSASPQSAATRHLSDGGSVRAEGSGAGHTMSGSIQ